jgi:hypothetical protein
MNVVTNTKAQQRRFESKIENSHSSAQKLGKENTRPLDMRKDNESSK